MPTKVLHVSLEYTYGVGGLKNVLTGLLPALQATNNISVSIITPYYDFINKLNLNFKPQQEVIHLYKKKIHTSIVFKSITQLNNLNVIQHYLISPASNSNVAKIFNINKPENIYKAFNHSEPQDRIEYFNSAVASFIKIDSKNTINFDIVQTHAWHTSLTICLIKEFEQLNWVKKNNDLQTNITPKIINTIHMLSNDQGIICGKREIAATLESVGLNLDLKFLYRNKKLNQMDLGLQYADQVLLVSKGLLKSIISGQNYGLGKIFHTLIQAERINTINNGINPEKFDPGLTENLGRLFVPYNKVNEAKLRLKNFLIKYYPNLNNNPLSIWYIYIGRFALEKGIDMLEHAFKIIKKKSDNLIIMGCYIGEQEQNSKIIDILNHFKQQKNVVVIDDNKTQALFGKHFRAASDFTLVPSHYEACGLVPMEAMINYSLPITSDVQGLPDTVIPLIENPTLGNGFLYNNDPVEKIYNLKRTITIARKKYLNMKNNKSLEKTLQRIYTQAQYYDWNSTPVKEYLQLYTKTLQTANASTPYIVEPFAKIKILHIALEYQTATWGGIGNVTTELLAAQNIFNQGNSFKASIVTPYYAIFPENLPCLLKIKHMYDHQEVESEVYLMKHDKTKHYLIKPRKINLFNINHPQKIYDPLEFIERIKYFNSAVASLIANYKYFKFNIIQLHDWTTALTAVLLTEIYKFNKTKIVYTVHINNEDRGVYTNSELAGIDLPLTKKLYTLKQLGIEYSNYVVGVSNNILLECAQTSTAEDLNAELDLLVKSFKHYKYTKNSIGILNGINYKKNCYIQYFLKDCENLSIKKYLLKQKLSILLKDKLEIWNINPTLPLILYIGRFSKEKGIGTFKKVIENIKNQAIFCAFGKGGNEEIIKLIINNSRKQNNIFISFSEKEQQKYGALMRAAAEFIFVPSLNEACGLVAMEGLANGSLCITSGTGGLKDFITQFHYNGEQFHGNGFLYQSQNEASLLNTIQNALNLWQQLSLSEKHKIHYQIMQQSKKLDWLAEEGAVHKYYELFKQILTFQPEQPQFFKNTHKI